MQGLLLIGFLDILTLSKNMTWHIVYIFLFFKVDVEIGGSGVVHVLKYVIISYAKLIRDIMSGMNLPSGIQGSSQWGSMQLSLFNLKSILKIIFVGPLFFCFSSWRAMS